MVRCLVVAPGSTMVSTVGGTHTGDASLLGISRRLAVAEKHQAVLIPSPVQPEPHEEALREVRLLVAALEARAALAVLEVSQR